jgi:hypothetical protein
MTPIDPARPTPVFQNVNEDGAVYGEHDSLAPAVARLVEYPNDSVVVRGEALSLLDIFGPPIHVITRADLIDRRCRLGRGRRAPQARRRAVAERPTR